MSKFQDGQALIVEGLAAAATKTKQVAGVLKAIRRPDLTEAEAAEAVGETKTRARKRTLDSRTVLIGLPAQDPAFHRCARNIEGVLVAPVAEFNTYDILKQRYLLLTREALAVLKERVKEKPARRSVKTRRPTAPPYRRAENHGDTPPSAPVSSAAARSWNLTRWSSAR